MNCPKCGGKVCLIEIEAYVFDEVKQTYSLKPTYECLNDPCNLRLFTTIKIVDLEIPQKK